MISGMNKGGIMNHTEGKVELEKKGYDLIIRKEAGGRVAYVFSTDDAERITALWNAADGMSNEEAVRYLTHAKEMVEWLRNAETLIGAIEKETGTRYGTRDIIVGILKRLEG
jgi:hypothetical protein